MSEVTEKDEYLKGLEKLENDAVSEDGEAGDDYQHDPKAEAEAKDLERQKEIAAEIAAASIVGMLEGGVTFFYPYVHYHDAQREKARDVIKPLCVKYEVGGELPPWLKPWKEEISAAVFFANVGFQTYLQVKAHEAAEAEAKANKGAENGNKSEHGAS